jgi:starch phosphorylase
LHALNLPGSAPHSKCKGKRRPKQGALLLKPVALGSPLNSMNKDKHSRYGLLPTEVEGLDALADLALDMRSSWNHAADELWRRLAPSLWELTHNPWIVLQTVSRDELQKALAEPAFRSKVDELVSEKKQVQESAAWFQRSHPDASLNWIAYFSMEFMLSEALPIYSGGLGNVAGDQLKAASDLGVPVIGVGLLWQQGYFRQVIGKGGVQQALYPYNDPGQLPISPVRQPNGEWLRLEVRLPGYSVWLRAWQVEAGRVKLYLLDSNDAANFPAHRGITSELYGGGPELRLKQELALGIGGWRLLRALGVNPEICHLNEGHAAFAVLERARHFMEETGQSFDTALTVIRAGNLFTTHTAVPAGFDRFAPALIEQYLGGYAQRLGITIQDLLGLGRLNPEDASEPFNMAYLAIRGSGAVNGVSRLHGQVSRRLFAPLFPNWPVRDVPVGHVTNGVHVATWDSAEADALWTSVCGKDRWLEKQDTLADAVRRVPDAQLWQLRTTGRRQLIECTRKRLAWELALGGAGKAALDRVRHLFDPNSLTIGFARRFATYKRPNLLLHDPERLASLLTNSRFPVQLIIAGKAHPADQAGQQMIQDWIRFITRPDVRPHAVFLSDYDMLLTEHLAQGVDLWLNTPRRPWEASGTSGMKVLVNGGLNLSELDGWWAEAYTPEVGWAIGDGREHDEDPAWDAAEAGQLYTLLEQQVIPQFYARDENGVPTAWVARMRESMARLTAQFSASRVVREYTERYYLPGLAAYRDRAADRGALGARIVEWERVLTRKWPGLRFGQLRVESSREIHTFEVQVFLDEIDPEAVRLELYADSSSNNGSFRQAMQRGRQLVGSVNGYGYTASVPADRPLTDYTPRIVPNFANVSVPLEIKEILWQK